MRTTLAAAILLATAAMGNAQEQEKKLIDRLLKPDMALQNNAQGKEFTAGGAISTKKAAPKSFYITSRSPEKQYTNVRKVGVKEFRTRESGLARRQANVVSQKEIAKVDAPYSTSAYAIRGAPGAEKVVEVSDYSGTRPFLVHGKSQKALSAQDHPLTIDEVRELLNKNK